MTPQTHHRGAPAAAVLVALAALGVPVSAEPPSPDPAFDGAALYAANCSSCHGVFGEGDGIVTPSLSVVLQDLRYLSQRNGGSFPVEFVTDIIDGRAVRAAHGPEGMPAWGTEFARVEGYGDGSERRAEAKIDALVRFLASIQILPEAEEP